MSKEDEDLKAALELHAAINGLRRGRREPSSAQTQALEAMKASRQKQQQQQQHTPTPQDTEDTSVSGQHRRERREAAEEEGPASRSTAEKREAKRARQQEAQDAAAANKGPQSSSGAALKAEQQKKKQSEGRKQRQKQEDSKDEDKGPPLQPELPAVSALEEAAHAAGAAAQARVKQAPRSRDSGAERRVKCFLAGLRWGINLTPDSLSTRLSLATALNDALAGSSQLLHCGRGDALSITMLDQEGNVAAEFPPLKTGEKQDSSSQWQSSVSAARRIYVAVSSSDS